MHCHMQTVHAALQRPAVTQARPSSFKAHAMKLRTAECRRAGRLAVRSSGDTGAEPSSSSSNDTFVPSSRARSAKPTLKQEAAASNAEVYDKLIQVFRTKTPQEWRKLIAYSKQWPSLAPGVLQRLEERAAAAAGGSDASAAPSTSSTGTADETAAVASSSSNSPEEEAAALRKLARRLASVHEELSSYQQLVERFRDAPSREWESIVVSSRPSLGTEFFNYLELRIKAAHETRKEQEALGALAAQVLALVEAHDRVMRDNEAMEAAAERFNSLLEVSSLEEAEKRIDELASSGRLDPALLLTMAKAYSGVKETDITKEEVKDIMAHLYFKAKESFAQQAPPEVRILKFLLSVDSPLDREKLMAQAFEAGPALSTSDADFLHTTPETLLNTVDNVLALYDGVRSGARANPMANDAAGLMNPAVIDRLRDMQRVIRKKFM